MMSYMTSRGWSPKVKKEVTFMKGAELMKLGALKNVKSEQIVNFGLM